MNAPDKRIYKFIKEHHVMNLATSKNNQPYISHCYYVFLPEENCFIFTSDEKTRHVQHFLENPKVSAGIALETKVVGKIRGLQITGEVEEAKDEWQKKAKSAYLKAFPYALMHLETLWILRPDFYKLTDNRLGFGTKIRWEKNS
jgi:uncharacterized protein YhbP (UPF0306 family)